MNNGTHELQGHPRPAQKLPGIELGSGKFDRIFEMEVLLDWDETIKYIYISIYFHQIPIIRYKLFSY